MTRHNHKNAKNFGIPGARTRDSRTRNIDKQIIRPRILIVCEGRKTEPNYFLAFRVTNDVYGEGLETIRVVERAIELNISSGPFDQIWCVFDRDSFPADHYDNAIHKVLSMSDKDFRVAYSNEAFELWYLLHFEFLNSAITREQYNKKLDKHLGQDYKKGDPRNYDLMRSLGDEAIAIKNAERLRSFIDPMKSFSEQCPATTVDLLVNELRQIQNLRNIE